MKKIIITLTIGLILISDIYALGIATDYGSDYLKLPQGISYKYSFRVQNMEDDPLPIRIELNDPSGIARLVGEKEEYLIQPKTTDNEFFIDITLPRKAEVGEKYKIKYKVKTGGGGNGQITFGRGITKEFIVEIVENTENPIVFWFKGLTGDVVSILENGFDNWAWLIGLALLVIVIIIVIIWKKSK